MTILYVITKTSKNNDCFSCKTQICLTLLIGIEYDLSILIGSVYQDLKEW